MRAVRRWGFLRLVNFLLRFPSHAFRTAVMRGLARNTVGSRVVIERGCRLLARGGVSIGDGSIINRDVTLDGRGGLSIGRNVNISPEVMILTAEHDVNSPEFAATEARVVIGDSAWVSTRALVLPGAVIERGGVLAAGGVLRGTIGEWQIAGGVPARRISERSPLAQSSLPEYRRWLH